MVAVGTNKAGVENTTSDTIDATDNHPFWVQSRGEWVDAIELQPGDVLLDERGNDILVTELAVTEQDLTAYNLTIDNIHTYYAGNQPTLVHNCPADLGGLHMGKQEKHIRGAANFDPNRSELTASPSELASRAGTGTPANSVPRGEPGFKERVDFGSPIGFHVTEGGTVRTPTSVGIFHYAKNGFHIVPGRPIE